MNSIIQSFCENKNIKYETLVGNTRKQPYPFYRQCLMYSIYKNMKIKHEDIGKLFSLNHSTVTVGIKRIKGYMSIEDEETKETTKIIDDLICREIIKGSYI